MLLGGEDWPANHKRVWPLYRKARLICAQGSLGRRSARGEVVQGNRAAAVVHYVGMNILSPTHAASRTRKNGGPLLHCDKPSKRRVAHGASSKQRQALMSYISFVAAPQ